MADVPDLSADELALKADALYWTGGFDAAKDAFEQAHNKFLEAGRDGDAGTIAALLGYFAFRRQSFSVAGGWIKRARDLLEGTPASIGHAWLRLLGVGQALFKDGDMEEALRRCDEIVEFAQTIGSPSSQSIAMSFKGLAMAQTGQWRDGIRLMDEAMVVAMSGSDDLRMTSDVYCNIISVCRNFGDYERAEEWTAEAERWMAANAVAGYTGACQVHRAELKLYHGAWAEAEAEALRAITEVERFQIIDYLGSAHYGVGEVRRRRGDYGGAQKAYDDAYASGHDGQPGVSLLMKDRGDTAGALDSIRRSALRKGPSDEDTWRGPTRARLLPALVEIALAEGETELAESAAEEMAAIADTFDSAVWSAQAAHSEGAVKLSQEEVDTAIELLEDARAMYLRLDLPYEMAQCLILLAQARISVGDRSRAGSDLRAARDVMTRLGASPQLAIIDSLAEGEEAGHPPPAPNVTRTFMFTDIVKSTDLIGVIGDESWRHLLSWHDRALTSAIETAGGEVVHHTGDGYFASFGTASQGIEAAVEIQRQLLEHRHSTGFAPEVRIGLHEASAIHEHGDYAGVGVHAAARIAALADGGEILVSAGTVSSAGSLPYPTESRQATLKGIAEPVDVCSLDWR